MGHGIAQISAMNGYQVVLRDIEQKFLDSAMDKIKWSLDKLVEKNKIKKEESDKIYGRIKPIVDLKDALVDTDLLIEAVPEDLNLKKKVYSEVDQFAEEKTVYASNTSTLPISEISQLTSRPDRFIGLHFFNPPQLMKLVEVIPGARTGKSIVDLGINLVKSLGKDPILCNKDVPGFIVNRIFIPLVHEAAHCLEFSSGKLGRKSGDGFYSYGDKNYERVPLSEEEAKQYDPIRMLSVALNNASWLITNKVCNKEDLELALRLGMGLKKELFEIGKEYGFENIINTLNELKKGNESFYTPDPYLVTLSK